LNPQVQACTWFNKDDLGFQSTQTLRGDDANLSGDDDGDGDAAVDDEDGTSPHAKGMPVAMTMLNSLR
jgi:hypothetical protein